MSVLEFNILILMRDEFRKNFLFHLRVVNIFLKYKQKVQSESIHLRILNISNCQRDSKNHCNNGIIY